MKRIARGHQFLTITRQWNGSRLVSTPEWQPYWTFATVFTTKEAREVIACMRGTLDELTTLVRHHSLSLAAPVPVDGVTLVH